MLFFACAFTLQSSGQNIENQFRSEEIKIHTSQQILFPGEVLWFSLAGSTSNAGQSLSTVAYVELINGNNTSVLRKKTGLTNGRGNSYFILPDSLNTGIYRILAYTSWMKNHEKNQLPTIELSIINPGQPLNSTILLSECNTITNSKTSDKSSVAQQNHVFQKRALVKIDGLFDKNKLNGSVVSVSVKHKEPILFTHDENNNTAQTASSNNEIYLPDYKGIIVSGKIYNKGNQIADGQEVLLSLPGEGADLLSSISDENGKFNFLLESQNGNCDMIFILPDSNMNIKLEDPFLSSINYSNNQTLCIDSVSMNYLKERYYYTQLAHNFDNPAYEPEPADTLKKQAFTFYSTPNRTYLTNDYIQLDSVAEYFRELIPSVHFNLEKNKYDLHIIGQTSKMELGNKPGVFVDGVFYTNFDNLAKIPANKLDRIEVLWDKYYYKDFTFDGIVSIHTKTSDFYSVDLQENMTRIIYPLTNRNSIRFKPKSYSVISTLSKVPDLRYLLYWNPSVDATKIDNLVFYTSDLAGTYEITISGYSFSGEWNTIITEFYVQ